MKQYFFRLAIAFDQFVNTLFGGHPDETFSASCYRKRERAWYWKGAYWFVNTLFVWQLHDHCKHAYEGEMNRDDLPREYR